MERITQRSLALTITVMLALATVAMSAPKSGRSNKYLTIDGRVLHVNRDARTLLVSDYWSKKLYLVNVPKKNDRVRMRCIRASDKDHLARLDDGREVVTLTATH